MRCLLLATLAVLLSPGTLAGTVGGNVGGNVAATRVVSLDYCADQYVLQFARREHIVGVSPDATREFSYLREQAAGLPVVRPIAEDVVITRPDLIVRSYGGGATAVSYFNQLGIPVVQLGYAGSLADIRQTILDVSAALGSSDRGLALVNEMDQRLNAIATQAQAMNHGYETEATEALYMTPAGVTSGPGTLVHDMLTAAALKNFATRPGWHALPLEKLAYRSPTVVALAFFEALTNHANVWSAIHHPVAQAQHFRPAAIPLQGAWTACGGWFVLDAIEALHAAASAANSGQQIETSSLP